MLALPPLHTFRTESYGRSPLVLYRHWVSMDVDGFPAVDFEVHSHGGDVYQFESDIRSCFELMLSRLPAILKYLEAPSAWSFAEEHGIDVTPAEVNRKVVVLSVSLDPKDQAISERAISVACSVADNYDVEPNHFDLWLDEAGAVIGGQLND